MKHGEDFIEFKCDDPKCDEVHRVIKFPTLFSGANIIFFLTCVVIIETALIIMCLTVILSK